MHKPGRRERQRRRCCTSLLNSRAVTRPTRQILRATEKLNYELFAVKVTGESLFEEWLSLETVAGLADKPAACDPDTARERPNLDQDYVPSPGEIRGPQKVLRICADRGLGIIAYVRGSATAAIRHRLAEAIAERDRSRTSFPFTLTTGTSSHEDYRVPMECERMPCEQAHPAGAPARRAAGQ
jgi:hypothetical protein